MRERAYRYAAASADGCVQRGRLAAESRAAAARVLADRGLHPIELASDENRASRGVALPIADLALALRLLADLLDAGLPLARALNSLETMVAPRVAMVLPQVMADVREGRGFAAALEQLHMRVPNEVLGVIRAGERGSGLALAIRQAAELCDDSATTGAAIRNALAYPALLAVAGTASLGLLIGIVLPRFAAILGDLGQTLPGTTRLVLQAGDVAKRGALPLLVALSVATIVVRASIGAGDVRRRWHALLLRVPVIGELRLGAAAARFCTSLSALLTSGVPLVAGLRSAASSTGDDEITARILMVRTDVEHGARFSDALMRRDASPALVQRLARAGEESGRLAAMLAHAGRLERERVIRRIRSLVRLLEPTMIVGFGGVVALVAAALLQALYSVRPAR